MEIPFHRRIAFRQSRTAILIVLGLTLILSSLHIGYDLLREQAQIEETVGQVIDMVRGSAAFAVYNYNIDLADNILTGLLAYKPIRKGRILDEFGTVLSARSRVLDPDSCGLISLLMDPEKPYSFPLYYGQPQAYIGDIEIRIDPCLAAASFIKRAKMVILGNILMSFIFSGILMRVFYGFLTRPLLRTASSLSRINPNTPADSRISVPENHEKDEMGLFIKTINGLLEGFQESLDREKAARMTIRESEERFRTLVESTSDWIWEVNTKAVFTYCSPKVKDILGYEVEEVLNKSSFDVMLPEDADRIGRMLDRGVGAEHIQPFAGVAWHGLRKDGRIVVVETSGVPIWDADHCLTGFRGINRDVTDREKAASTLRKYEHIVSSSSDLMALVDDHYIYQAVNDAYLRAFASTREKIIGRSIKEIIGEHPFEHNVRQKLEQCLKRGEINFKIWIDYPGIGRRYMDVHYYPFYEKRVISGIVINARDITETRKLEEQLIQAQKMEAVGTLAGGIAHDFNNLLMGIQGNTSLMLVDMNSSHPHYEKLRHIQQCVKTGSDLARQLLGFSSKGEHHAIPVDINNAVRESYEIFGRTKKEITVHLRLEPCVWTVEADPSQIEQVLLNLYINAWQAMPSGGDLFIKTQNLTLSMADTMPYGLTPGPYVRISVTDTGVGIDNSIQDRIFDPFFTTKERGRGTGLGLASAYGIIKNHGGFIKVYSEVGKGAAFNIFLPASVELKAVSKDEPEARVLRGSETLLLVDDEDIILDVGTLMLEELGYTVLRAPNGYKALEVYAQNKDDIRLVILDMIMPDMSGAQVFDALRHMDSQVRILLSTGYSVNGQASEILKKGCNGFIQKPFKLDQLSCKIRDIIDADAYKTEA